MSGILEGMGEAILKSAPLRLHQHDLTCTVRAGSHHAQKYQNVRYSGEADVATLDLSKPVTERLPGELGEDVTAQ